MSKQILLKKRRTFTGKKNSGDDHPVHTIVSDVDFDFLQQWSWYLSDGYVVRYWQVDGKSRKLYLHRVILQRKIGNLPRLTDHINCDRLDNRRENLREATHCQNGANRRKQKNNTVGMKGVCRNHNLFSAFLRSKYLGTFRTAEEAHAEYERAAKEEFGEFARSV